MAHVELSLTESYEPDPSVPALTGSVAHWASTVNGASEACLVLNSITLVMAASASACTMLGLPDQTEVFGTHLIAGPLRLLDFTGSGAALPDSDMEKIPPVLAFTSGRLARGLLRVKVGAEIRTVDAIATPLFDGSRVVGSLSFFAII